MFDGFVFKAFLDALFIIIMTTLFNFYKTYCPNFWNQIYMD